METWIHNFDISNSNDSILTDPANRDNAERINDKMILLSDGYGER